MCAWSHDAFGNDSACDWTAELEACADLSALQSALQSVLDIKDEYLEEDVGARGVAACEVIARLRGHAGEHNSYTESVDRWVAMHSQLNTDSLLKNAHLALDRITGYDSELADEWSDGDTPGEWHTAIDDLRSRLK